MIMIDGFRNCRCWHRLIIYLFFIIKSFTSIARTFFDWIDENLYPESTVWLEDNPKQTKIIDNVDRFGWFFVGIISLISFIKTLNDPKHQYFIMKMERLSRDEVINIINNKDKINFINPFSAMSYIHVDIHHIHYLYYLHSLYYLSQLNDYEHLNGYQHGYRTLLKMDL